MAVMPRESYDWTVDDLEDLPDDGLQYELVDGILLVSPAPVPVHQAAIGELFVLLRSVCPKELKVFMAPLDWQPDHFTSLQPDVLVVARADIGAKNITRPLPLAVEVLSPSTRRKDRVLKFSKYADSGVRSYWVVDPVEQSIVAYELVDGAYTVAGRADGAEALTLESPYPVTVVPAELVDI
ncbi:Uma2 family endonuclease [Haloactinopolyspora alba]|nr:Uma2 family endonuclease [Haloactinopolyspora alba]